MHFVLTTLCVYSVKYFNAANIFSRVMLVSLFAFVVFASFACVRVEGFLETEVELQTRYISIIKSYRMSHSQQTYGTGTLLVMDDLRKILLDSCTTVD